MLICRESNLSACESLLYSGSATAGGAPSLSPQAIVDTLTQLNDMLKKLEQAVMDVIKDWEHKKKVRLAALLEVGLAF